MGPDQQGETSIEGRIEGTLDNICPLGPPRAGDVVGRNFMKNCSALRVRERLGSP